MVAEAEPPVFESPALKLPAASEPPIALNAGDNSIESFVEQQFASVHSQLADQQSVSKFTAAESSAGTALPFSPPPAVAVATAPVAEKMVERVLPNFGWVAAYGFAGLVWLVGVGVLLIRLAWSYRKLNLLRKRSPHADNSEQLMCRDLANRLNVPTPEVRRNSLLSSPCLTGITSPSILLPSEITEPVPMEKAFAHELAHVRRRDNIWNLIQRMALSLFFFQPLMWRLVYRLEATAEEVCDDFVVRHCMDRTGYAEQLVALAESNLLAPNMAGLGMFKSSKSALGHRVMRILDTTRKLTTQLSWPAIIAVFALTMIAATLGGFLGNDGNPFSFRADESADTSTTPLETENKPATETVANLESAEGTLTFSGRVVDANGSPVQDATVRIVPRYFRSYDRQASPILATTNSDSNGKFEIRLSQAALISFGAVMDSAKNFQLVVSAPDHGFSWIGFDGLQESLDSKSDDHHQTYSNIQVHLTDDTTRTKLRAHRPGRQPHHERNGNGRPSDTLAQRRYESFLSSQNR